MITPDFSAYAARMDIHLHSPISPSEIQAKVEGLMTKIALSCLADGAVLIGHIKCIVETDEKGFLAVSVTTHDGKAVSRGRLGDGIEKMTIIINVLLYGLSRKRLQEIVDPLAIKELSFPGAHVTIEDLEKPHQGGMIHIHDDGDHGNHH